jgi:4-amino-4-deoxy-L-arabinose transferase-like glycosyltransferase
MMLRVNERRTSYAWGAAALVAGAVLRAVFVHFHARFVGDALTYGDLAHNMLFHHIFGFTDDRVRPTLIRLPGYPAFLAACFRVFGDANFPAVLWVQVVVDLLSCALLGVLAGRLMGRRAGLAAVWLAALCPFTANYAAAVLTETLSLFCVVLAMFGLERWSAAWRAGERGTAWASVTGAALAYAVLLRPDQGLLAAAVVPAMAWVGLGSSSGRRRWVAGLRPAAIASVIVVLPLLAWGVRNKHTMHVFQPLAPRYANEPGELVLFGFQRWYRTWAIDFKSTVDVYWNYDGDVLRLEDLPPRAFDNPEEMAATSALYAQYNVQATVTPAIDAGFGRLADERAKAHPLRFYVLLPLARDLNMWLRPRTELMKMPVAWWDVRAHPKRSLAAMAYAGLNAVYLALGCAGLWMWGRRGWSGNRPLVAAMVAFVALRFVLLLTLDNSEPRYTLECFPVVILLAGVGLSLWGSYKNVSREGR